LGRGRGLPGLAAARPAAFRPDLATSLNNLSNTLAELGRREDALAAIDEAVEVYRELAAKTPSCASCFHALQVPSGSLSVRTGLPFFVAITAIWSLDREYAARGGAIPSPVRAH
jgi:Tetratricopeptide repeat